eukprot:480303_1
MSSQSNTYRGKYRRGRGRVRWRGRGNKQNTASYSGRGRSRGRKYYNTNYKSKTSYQQYDRNKNNRTIYKDNNCMDIEYKLSLFEDNNKASTYQCRICKHVCRNAVELLCYECNNNDFINDKDLCYCQSCLNTHLNTNNYTCPLNKNHKNVSYKHSKYIRNKINNLIINCPSCKWKNTVYKFKYHSQNECKMNNTQIQTVTQHKASVSKQPQCYLMCSYKESDLRLHNKQYHKIFECNPNNKYTKYSLIKEYVRSSAGQQIDFKQVRCPSVLRLTLQYLMNIILNNISISYIARFAFIEDRIRAIIKDIYVQS